MAKFRIRPHEFEAIRFTGGNWVELTVLCGTRKDDQGEEVPVFQKVGSVLVSFAALQGAKASLWSESRKTEVYVKVGDWIVHGREGFEAVDHTSFQRVYEEVT